MKAICSLCQAVVFFDLPAGSSRLDEYAGLAAVFGAHLSAVHQSAATLAAAYRASLVVAMNYAICPESATVGREFALAVAQSLIPMGAAHAPAWALAGDAGGPPLIQPETELNSGLGAIDKTGFDA